MLAIHAKLSTGEEGRKKLIPGGTGDQASRYAFSRVRSSKRGNESGAAGEDREGGEAGEEERAGRLEAWIEVLSG